MGISDEACVGTSVGAGVIVAGGIGGCGVLEMSMPARSMSALRLLVGSLPAEMGRKIIRGTAVSWSKGSEQCEGNSQGKVIREMLWVRGFLS